MKQLPRCLQTKLLLRVHFNCIIFIHICVEQQRNLDYFSVVWLVPMRYHTKLRSNLCDVNLFERKTLYCNKKNRFSIEVIDMYY